MTSRRRRRRLVAAVSAIALLTAACGSGDDGSTERSSDPTAPATGPDASADEDRDTSDGTTGAATGDRSSTSTTAPGAVTTQPGGSSPDDSAIPTTSTSEPPAIRWTSCGRDGLECATVEVPLDHDVPGGPVIPIAVARLPATGERIGPLFVNFGGPGAGAVDRLGRLRVPAEIRARFDLVAFDPRGVGDSEAFDCGIDPVTLYSLDPTFEDDIDRSTFLSVSRDYAADCAEREGSLLPHLGTVDVARDMDRIRAAMGDDTLSYVGYSYGTVLGQVHAQLFPARSRATILDAVVDPAMSGIQAAVAQAEGSDLALTRWAAACPGRDTCRFDDPLAAVDEVLARSEEGIASSGGRRSLTRGTAHIGISLPLYAESLWDDLDVALADAVDGDAAALVTLADRYAGLTDFAVYFGVNCLDSTFPTDVDDFIAEAESAADVSPRFGTPVVIDYLRCAVWPVPAQPIGPITAPDAPPILVVSTTGDPATPHDNGIRVARRLARARLLTHEGEGHTIVFRGSGCVDDVAVAYLVGGQLPAEGARC